MQLKLCIIVYCLSFMTFLSFSFHIALISALHLIEEGHVPHHVLSFVEGNVVWASTLDGLLHGELDDVVRIFLLIILF